MLARTLTDMLSDIRQRTNMETSTFVTDAELTEYLNVGLRELWMRLCQNGGQPFYRSTTSIAVVIGQSLYPLPQDFLVLQGVEGNINGFYARIDSFMPAERAGQVNAVTQAYPYGSPVRYRLQGGAVIEFLPSTTAFTATLFYTPTCPRLVNASDTFDGFDGFEIAAIYHACASVREKEETDPSFYRGERDRIYAQIDQMAATRDMSAPERVQDVMGGLYGDGDAAGMGWYR